MTGDELREMLAGIGWKQSDLARKLGVHRNTVSSWVASQPPKWAAEYVQLLAVIDGVHRHFVMPSKIDHDDNQT